MHTDPTRSEHDDREPRRPKRPLTPDVLAGDGPESESERKHVAARDSTPSQAEGDRETVEADIRGKEPLGERGGPEADREREIERRSGAERRRQDRRRDD